MNKSSGLTLIELIVVMGLIGILASAVITLINPIGQIAKANDAKRKSDLAQIQRALELSFNDNKIYPASVPFGTSPWSTYMAKVPDDPKSTLHYQYVKFDNNTYCLYASLENTQDPQRCSASPCTNAGASNCGGTCNYGVCSPNKTP